MSRRRSTGDLVPRDITEILAREAKAQRGQKKSGSSLGQAFSWLRKSRRKKSLSSRSNRIPNGVAENKLGHHNADAANAGLKGSDDQKRLTVQYTASRHYQENVFIEGSRPQYIEDLHTEAQEGLKILQQEVDKNGVNFADNESIISSDTLCPEQGISSKDRDGSLQSRSITNNETTATPAGITLQGSTFKPLNPEKRHNSSKKRNRRTTIMGIPNQVQKELALNRSSTFQPLVSTQLPNHADHDADGQSSVVVIPTVDGGTPLARKEGARVHLSELEQVCRDEQDMKNHLQGVYKNGQAHICLTSTMRPKSIAVPSMTTSVSISPSMLNFLREPQGPVMSISPQATYLSTIIPNAVLPASVEVIEIDRSNSRTRGSSVNHGNGTCAVSKCSLTSEESAVSPLLSRRSDGDGSQINISNYDSALTLRSASSSNWSEPQSSKNIIPDSMVAPNSAGLNLQERQTRESVDGQDLTSFCSSVNAISALNKTEADSGHGVIQSLTVGDQANHKRNCLHSLSVTKTKHPPAPPRRTNSLHGKKVKSESMIVVEFEDLSNCGSGEVKGSLKNIVADDGDLLVATNSNSSPELLSNSTGPSLTNSSSKCLTSPEDSGEQNEEAAGSLESDPSSPQKTPSDGETFERTMSPSSGYSSQSGTPTLSPKEISPNSPNKQKKKPIKPGRSASRASSSAASPSSSLTSLSSGTSEPANVDVTTCSVTLSQMDSSPTKVTPSCKLLPLRVEVQELFNIPSPPKVKAPCPPPPETWAHSRRTVELLIKTSEGEKQVETQRELRKGTQKSVEDRTTEGYPVLEISVHTENPKIKDPEDGKSELKVNKCSDTEQIHTSERVDAAFKSRVESDICVVNKPESQEASPKKEPPPVMKKTIKILFKDKIKNPLETQERKLSCRDATEFVLSVEDHTTPSQSAVVVSGDKSKMERDEVQSMQTLTVDVPKMSKLSPPPTPPPAYQPTPPPIRKPGHSLMSTTPNESEKEHDLSHVVDSCWPPPPPPLEGEPVFDGGDEVDFPLPPPPSIREDVTDLMEVTPDTSAFPLADNTSPDVEQVSKAKKEAETDAEAEASSHDISYIAEPVSPLPPVPPGVRADSPKMVQTVIPACSYLNQKSLKLEDQTPSAVTPELPVPTSVHKAPPPHMEIVMPAVNFRRPPNGAYRESRSNELLSRHKSAPIHKEDASLPLVTPSLLQMLRLRTVSMSEDQIQPISKDIANEASPVLENCVVSTQVPQNVPLKPIRKSLSVKSPPQTVKTSTGTMNSPSLRLQEAIRIKTASMSSRDCLAHTLGVKSTTYGCINEPGGQSLKSMEGCDMLKSPASTASFIFSRSTRKVVLEPVVISSSEAQASLKQSLAAELKQVSDQSKVGVVPNGKCRSDRIPPPVAKKPVPGSTSPLLNSNSSSGKVELKVEGNKAGQPVAPPKTTTRVTANTIETLF